jgi:hypothetical protein
MIRFLKFQILLSQVRHLSLKQQQLESFNEKILDYRIKDLGPSHLGFRRLSMDNYYCTPINRNNSRLQIIKDGRDTMNLVINNAKGTVFLQTIFQEGNFVVNLQQKDYEQAPKKKVRTNGTMALDISRLLWREIKSDEK